MRLFKLVLVLCFAALGVGAAATAAGAQQTGPPLNAPPVFAGNQTYRIFADVVTAGVGQPGVQGALCVNQTVFFPGDIVVFRAAIADGATGIPLTPVDVQERGLKVVVTLSDGTTVPVTLKTHPPPPNAPRHSTFWSGSTRIPATHPTGTLSWTLTATDRAGNSASFVPLGQDAGTTVLTIAQKK
jgi:hypothetical protein